MKKILILGGVALMLAGCSSGYEGLSAKEWFDLYDQENERFISIQNQYNQLLEEVGNTQLEAESLMYENEENSEELESVKKDLEEALETAEGYRRKYESIKTCSLTAKDDSCYYYH